MWIPCSASNDVVPVCLGLQMKRSTVVGNSGNGVVDDIRTSYGMFIRR